MKTEEATEMVQAQTTKANKDKDTGEGKRTQTEATKKDTYSGTMRESEL